jgi:hypothetical protein
MHLRHSSGGIRFLFLHFGAPLALESEPLNSVICDAFPAACQIQHLQRNHLPAHKVKEPPIHALHLR